MPIILYHCDDPGDIKQISLSEKIADPRLSNLCIVYKYDVLYKQESERFGENTPYALPGKNKTMRIYNGFDRDPLDNSPLDEKQYSYAEMQAICRSLDNRDELEIIYVRASGSGISIPAGMSFLGYDVSAICDCMFLSRWHGCDENGTEFIEEFSKLNENGLFSTSEEAEKYLYHYLSQEWAETGDFIILEIYR